MKRCAERYTQLTGYDISDVFISAAAGVAVGAVTSGWACHQTVSLVESADEAHAYLIGNCRGPTSCGSAEHAQRTDSPRPRQMGEG
jgi:hypothetical protein